MNLKKIVASLFTLFAVATGSAQSNDALLELLVKKGFVNQKEIDSIRKATQTEVHLTTSHKTFLLDLQIKNRLEYRNGYGNIPDASTAPAAFVNQRSRINFSYQDDSNLNAVFSIQDARVWGSKDPKGLNGTIQLFEGYIEPFLTHSLSIRIGRQCLAYDNQRLFAENEWRVNAGAHDAINLRFKSKKLNTELVGAFNQTSERFFGTDFTPTELSTTAANSTPSTWTNYKALLVHYLKYQYNDVFTLTTITASDAYQDAINKEQNYWRFTYGGRLEYQKKQWYLTTNTYFQSGRNTTGKTINAWYLQPELRYTSTNKITIKLGAEILSGDNGKIGAIDHNFVPLYGVAHRFNGSLDYFTRFPTDLNNAGLVNPYFYISKTINSHLEISSNNHLFYTQKSFVTAANTTLTKFMGYEHDLLITYKPNSYTAIESGFSVALPSNTLTAIKKTGDANRIPTWAYVQVKFTPTLFNSSF
ncbi:alginate export family protein [Flavobacterium sp.]|uniref:alginate export family protein n=1 Tax=Flavobacterium sp. TaxID=239 RepID=UPI00262599C8|nr:alginate export family protein [Flavobacterium sp.]MDG2433429.1 alginate export family protein [Flavobacterium sp.]